MSAILPGRGGRVRGGAGIRWPGASRRWIITAVEHSLRPLQTDYTDIVEAQWIAERRGYERFRCEQPPYSILDRGIERDILPIAERYRLGTIVWSPLAQGLLTGRLRRDQPSGLLRAIYQTIKPDIRTLLY
jgi:aryl-alcohol dehydrogenase-like predicted oxidoreductase